MLFFLQAPPHIPTYPTSWSLSIYMYIKHIKQKPKANNKQMKIIRQKNIETKQNRKHLHKDMESILYWPTAP